MRLGLAKYLGGGYQPQGSLGASPGFFLFRRWLLALLPLVRIFVG